MSNEFGVVGSIIIDKFSSITKFGGSAGNVAMGLGLLNAGKTTLVTALGRDDQSKQFTKLLEEAGVFVLPLDRNVDSLPVCEYVLSPDGSTEYISWTDNGLGDAFSLSVPRREDFNGFSCIHLAQCEGNFALKVARIAGDSTKVSYNPGAWLEGDLDTFASIQPLASYIFLNEQEYELLRESKYCISEKDLLISNSQTVVITRGSKPTRVITSVGEVDVDVIKISPVDTTGAGDAFCSAFLWAAQRGYGISLCVKLGNLLGSIVVGEIGGMPSKSHVAQFLKASRNLTNET